MIRVFAGTLKSGMLTVVPESGAVKRAVKAFVPLEVMASRSSLMTDSK